MKNSKISLLILIVFLGAPLLALAFPSAALKAAKPAENEFVHNIIYNGNGLGGTKYKSSMQFIAKVLSSDQVRRCTGVLIHNRFVLTAAHCFENFENKNFDVYLPLNDSGKNFERIRVLSYTLHADAKVNGTFDYAFSHYENNTIQDVALLLLHKAPKWAKPIKLLGNNSELLKSYANRSYTLGYYRDKEFNSTEFMANAAIESVENIGNSNYKIYIAAGDMGICKGDSGGPTIISYDDGDHYLVGVLSSILGTGITGLKGSTYTEPGTNRERALCSKEAAILHTGHLVPWIKEAMAYLSDRAKIQIDLKIDSYKLLEP